MSTNENPGAVEGRPGQVENDHADVLSLSAPADQQIPEPGSKLGAALSLASRGFRVLPVRPNTKIAALDKWQVHASTDPGQVKTWWAENPDYNVAIVADDLLYLDVDVKNGACGKESLTQLEAKHSKLPATLAVNTPSGGQHYYFRAGGVLRQGVLMEGAGIDIKNGDGYVLAPGSTLPNGAYTWAGDPSAAVADLPGWLRKVIGTKAPPRQMELPPGVKIDTQYACKRAAFYLTHEAKPSIQGQHGNENAFKVACRVRELGVPRDECMDLMLGEWNQRCEPSWTPDELADPVYSAYKNAKNSFGCAAPEAQFPPIDALGANGEPLDLTIEAMAWTCPSDAKPFAPDLAEMQRTWPERYAHLVDWLEMMSIASPAQLAGIVDAATDVQARRNPLAPRAITQISPRALMPRRWIVRDLLIRENVTLVVAQPGAGKSTLALTAMLAIAAGRDDILGRPVVDRCPVWYWNNEDPEEELERRLAAAMQLHKIKFADLVRDGKPMFHMNTGVHRPLHLAIRGGNNSLIPGDTDEVVAFIKKHGIGLFGADPFVGTHQGEENDNKDMDFALGQFRTIAQRADCAAMAVHHTRKPASGDRTGTAGDPNSARGGGSLIGVARVVLTLEGMKDTDAKAYGIKKENVWRYMRLDAGKANMSPGADAAHPVWFEKVSVKVPEPPPGAEFDPAATPTEEVGALRYRELRLPVVDPVTQADFTDATAPLSVKLSPQKMRGYRIVADLAAKRSTGDFIPLDEWDAAISVDVFPESTPGALRTARSRLPGQLEAAGVVEFSTDGAAFRPTGVTVTSVTKRVTKRHR